MALYINMNPDDARGREVAQCIECMRYIFENGITFPDRVRMKQENKAKIRVLKGRDIRNWIEAS